MKMATRKMHQNGDQHGRAETRRSRSSKTPSKTLSAGWLRDFLSEMLAVEKGGVKLYEKALKDLKHSKLKPRLAEFLRQTQHHVKLCTGLLTAAGGESVYRSAGAEAANHKAEGLLSTEVPEECLDLNNIENLLLAETKDHWNWEILASVLSGISDKHLKQQATKSVREVRKQEKMHLSWNKSTLSELAIEAARKADDREFEEREAVGRGALVDHLRD
jgi:rubrerythrin